MGRQYYSSRHGNKSGENFTLEILREIFYSIFSNFEENGYFQEALGYYCVDADWVNGKVGTSIEGFFLRKLRKVGLWPISEKYKIYTEEDIFDVIELLYDLVSKPIDGSYHSWSNCGWHYDNFDKEEGQSEFRIEINSIIKDYREGYELSEVGEILTLEEEGINYLLEADIPKYDPDNIDNKLSKAIHKFRSFRSSIQDRKDAIRELADILEFIRPQIKDIMFTKDEKDLFNIANNFGIRHHNTKQKTDIDPLYLSWIFYIYLSTIHMMIRILKKNQGSN